MPKLTMAVLAERLAVVESEVVGLRSALAAIPMGTAPQNRPAVVQGRKIFRDPETQVKVFCAHGHCQKFASTTRGLAQAAAASGSPWKCSSHRPAPVVAEVTDPVMDELLAEFADAE